MRDSAQVNSGSAIVTTKGGKISLGAGVQTPARYTLKADTIAVGPGANAASDLYYNILTNNGTTGGSRISPVGPFPLVTLPPFEGANPGTKDVLVLPLLKVTLPPGQYRYVFVSPLGTLALTGGGAYDMKTLEVENYAKVTVAAPAHIHVAQGMEEEGGSYFGPAQGSTVDATGIVVYVAGPDSLSPFLKKAADIGPCATFYGTIYAQHGTVLLDDQTQATGSYLGVNVTLGKKTVLTLASAFTGLAKSGVWTQEPDIAGSPAVPATYALEQNYPNPFNPTTQIRYGLPAQSPVTLTVYNILGQEIARLVDDVEPAGFHVVQWNGQNARGVPVSSGVYFYRITAGRFTDTRKMLLMK